MTLAHVGNFLTTTTIKALGLLVGSREVVMIDNGGGKTGVAVPVLVSFLVDAQRKLACGVTMVNFV